MHFFSLSLSPEIALTTETSNNQRRGRCSLVLLVGGQGDQKRPALVDLPADSYSLSLIGKLNSVTAPLSPRVLLLNTDHRVDDCGGSVALLRLFLQRQQQLFPLDALYGGDDKPLPN